MKTTMKLIAIALIASLLGACSSSLQMSKSSSYQGDDLYYSPKASQEEVASNQNQRQQTSSSLKLAELERKYTEILANDSIGSIDSTIYNDPYVNPYERILADSYEDAYQRRLDARRDPYYGISNWSAYYSNDYWYASAYDPSFYNVMVVGSSVWVEPRYVSSMFGWPYFGSRYYSPYYSFGLGFHSPYYAWGYSNWYSPWSTYGGYNTGLYGGYYNGHNTGTPSHNYGRRPGSGIVNYDRGAAADASYTAGINSSRRDMADRQVTYGSAIASPQDPDTKTRVAADRQGKTTKVVEPVRGKDNSIVSRPSRDNVNHTRVSTVNARTSSRSGERTHNPSYTRPNPGNESKFNAPSSRNYPASDGVRSGTRPGQSVTGATRSPRQSSPSYTPPPRSSSPAIGNPRSSGRSQGSGVSNSGTRGSSNVGSSSSSGRSSSVGTSSSGSSSGTSSTGSSGTSTRSR